MKSFRQYFETRCVTEAKDELADMIRQSLKKAGYKVPSQISVRKRSASAYDVEIKSLDIDKDEIEKIVKKFEDIDRDERTGEILSGGNTYVFVSYDYGMMNKERERLRKLEEETIQKCLANNGKYVKLGKGLEISIFTDDDETVMPGGLFRYIYKLNGKEYHVKNGIFPVWRALAKAGF